MIVMIYWGEREGKGKEKNTTTWKAMQSLGEETPIDTHLRPGLHLTLRTAGTQEDRRVKRGTTLSVNYT